LEETEQSFFSLNIIKSENFSQDPNFIRGLTEPFVELEQAANNDKKMIVITPIYQRDAALHSDPIGVIIAKMRTLELDEILLSKSGLGETGEVYLVDENHFMISESRFVENSVFNQKVDTPPVVQCFNIGNDFNDVYYNYRSATTYGSSYCAKDLGFVLLAEIERDETLQPLLILQDRIFLTGIIITTGMGMIAKYGGKFGMVSI